MLSTSFNYIYEQRSSRFSTRLNHWLFPDGSQIAVRTDTGLRVHTDSGFADNIYCFILVLLCIFKFCYCTDL